MFLDSLNCYHINGVGIFVFFPEIGQVIFYKEKIDKNQKFNNVDGKMEDGKYKLYFTLGKTTAASTKGLLQSMKSLVRSDILFYSQHDNNNFNDYFLKERIQKQDHLSAIHQIDYLLVLKQSDKIYGKSKIEHRILRIDWRETTLKYYGDEGLIEIYDFMIPVGHIMSASPDTIDSLNGISGVKPDDLTNYKNQLLLNGYGCALLAPSNDKVSQLRANLITNLALTGILKSADSNEFNGLMDKLCKSNLKSNWIERAKPLSRKFRKDINENIYEVVRNIDYLATNATHKNLQYSQNMVDMTNVNNELRYSKMEYDEYPNPDMNLNTTIKIVGDEELVFNLTSANYKETKRGADNAYLEIMSNKNIKYGVRFSQIIYLANSINLYNNIIENLINIAMYSYLNPDILGVDPGSIPRISKIVKYGLMKIKIHNPEGKKEEDGYIPYTVYEPLEGYETIKSYISKITQSPDKSNSKLNLSNNNTNTNQLEENIKQFILKVLCQIYNFYNIAKTYFNFMHNDFKVDNILIHSETGNLCIIDFGKAKMNIYNVDDNNKTKIFNVGNVKFNMITYAVAGETYGEAEKQKELYEEFIVSLNDRLYSDSDIETLIWWLMFYYQGSKSNNTFNTIEHQKYAILSFELLKPILCHFENRKDGFLKPGSDRTKSEIGILIDSSNKEFDYTKYSWIKFRLYQLYMVLHTHNFQCNFIMPDSTKPFLAYITNYSMEDERSNYNMANELLNYCRPDQPRPALPAAQAPQGISFAGGSRHTKKYRNRNHKNTHTRKHSSKRTRTTRRRIHNKKHNTSQKR